MKKKDVEKFNYYIYPGLRIHKLGIDEINTIVSETLNQDKEIVRNGIRGKDEIVHARMLVVHFARMNYGYIYHDISEYFGKGVNNNFVSNCLKKVKMLVEYNSEFRDKYGKSINALCKYQNQINVS